MLRLAGALLYISLGMAALFAFVPQMPPPLYFLAFFALVLSSQVLFNEDALARFKRTPFNVHILELERKGKATRETVVSSRSLFFEDLGAGSPAYLVDVPRKGLLCLYGQYLYEWSPIDDDTEQNQPRDFPRSEFDLVRRKKTGDVLTLELRGSIYEPEELKPSPELVRQLPFALRDGTYIRGVTYEAARTALNGA